MQRMLRIACLTAGALLCSSCSAVKPEPPRVQVLAPPLPESLLVQEALPPPPGPEASNEDGIRVCSQVVYLARRCQGRLAGIEEYYRKWESRK